MTNRTDEKAVLNLVINGQAAKTTIKELSDGIRKYDAEIRNMKKSDNPAEYESKARAARTLKAALAEAKKEVNGVTEESKKFQSSWKDIAKGVIAGGFIQQGLGMLKDFGSQVIETYSKYEKFLAVLENTLGSSQAARLAFNDIKEFAKQTPFQLDELTESYVKLVNRGFQPTMGEMRKMADLAASQGKSMDQLVEAILDAQTGEFERLKDLGLRASKNGDTVAISFKGITKEVANTDEAIRNAIISFGELEGVQGATAKTSETVGGKISNLADSWDQLLATIGSRTGGVIFSAVTAIGSYLDWLNDALLSAEEKISNNIDKKVNATLASFKQLPNESLDPFVKSQQSQIEGTIALIKDYEAELAKLKPGKTAQEMQQYYRSGAAERAEQYKQLIEEQKRTLQAYKDFQKQEVDTKKKAEDEKARIARQKASEENERLKKEAEKKAAEFEKEKQNLKKLAADIQTDFNISGLEGLDQKLAEISKKYDPLIEKAKKFKDAATTEILEALKIDESGRATDDFQRKQTEEFQKARSKEFGDTAKNVNEGFAERSLENQDSFANGELSEEELQQLEYDQEHERLLALQMLAQAYGESDLEYQATLSERKLEQKQKEIDQRKQLAEKEREIEIATLENMSAGVGLLKGLVNQRGNAFKALLVAEKAIAISQVIMSTQKEIAGYYAAYSWMPGGAAVATGLATAAKVRAGISIATIVAQGAKELSGSDSNKKYAKGGFVPNGPSHAQGGIKMVDNLTGAVIGEMEGGEPILSKDTYRNNKQTIDALLYNSQRKNGTSISIDSGMIASNERYYRNGGIAGARNPVSVISKPVVNIDNVELLERIDQLIEAQKEANEKRVIFSHREFEESNERRVKIRSGVNA